MIKLYMSTVHLPAKVMILEQGRRFCLASTEGHDDVNSQWMVSLQVQEAYRDFRIFLLSEGNSLGQMVKTWSNSNTEAKQSC